MRLALTWLLLITGSWALVLGVGYLAVEYPVQTMVLLLALWGASSAWRAT